MKSFTPGTLIALAASCLSLAAVSHSSGALVHDYEIYDSLADSLGGPSLIPNGGTLNAADYSFGPSQGLTLSNALPNPAEYSILIDFSFSSLGGYRRIIDFKNLTSDTGLYNLNSALNFYPVITGPPAFVPDTEVRLVLTRDAVTGVVTGYINGILQISFADGGNLAVFDAGNAIMHFFIDDFSVGGEASGGRVSEIAIYDSPLTPAEVVVLGGPGPIVPEPGSGLLCLSALAACLGGRLRRSNG